MAPLRLARSPFVDPEDADGPAVTEGLDLAVAVDDVADVEGLHLAEVSALRRFRLLHTRQVGDRDLWIRENNIIDWRNCREACYKRTFMN